MSEKDWVEVIATGGEFHDFDEEKVLIGKYIGMRSNIGKNNSNVYDIVKNDGTEVSMWGSSVIDSRMEKVPVGYLVKVEMTGKKESKSGRSYYTFNVFYKPDTNEVEDDIKF